jgi:predicted transcriptional regulator with HTH domain
MRLLDKLRFVRYCNGHAKKIGLGIVEGWQRNGFAKLKVVSGH